MGDGVGEHAGVAQAIEMLGEFAGHPAPVRGERHGQEPDFVRERLHFRVGVAMVANGMDPRGPERTFEEKIRALHPGEALEQQVRGAVVLHDGGPDEAEPRDMVEVVGCVGIQAAGPELREAKHAFAFERPGEHRAVAMLENSQRLDGMRIDQRGRKNHQRHTLG
jgi:hypothetical protein